MRRALQGLLFTYCLQEQLSAAQDFEVVEAPLFGRVSGQLAVAREQARVAELKTGEAVQEARVWARVKTGAEAEKEEARHVIEQAHVELDRSERLAGLASELQQQLATDGARQGGGNAGSGPVTAGRAGGSLPTSPRSPVGPMQRAARLARQAADLEEESKRVEAQACYLHREAAQLGELARQKQVKADELELDAAQLEQAADNLEQSVAAALEEAQKEYQARAVQFSLMTFCKLSAEDKQREAGQLERRVKQLTSEAYQLVKQADARAAQAEADLPGAEQAAQHAEAARSALTQARRDAQLLSQRSQQLTGDAEKKMAGAAALAQRAFEKAQESFSVKKAALLEAPEAAGEGAAAGPTTPEVAPQAQRLAGELERVQRGRAAAELHASQLIGQAHEKVAHASRLEHSAERSAEHVRRVLADAAQAHAQEGEALERAQRAGEAASSLAGERMAEQWIALTRTPEWRTLAARFPATIRQLSAAAAAGGDGEGGGAASHVEWVGSGGERHDEAT
ncbi:hypothetical protein COHA_005127 [Chlorella ohadii]|uniref:Uncharacterized protein n=1 Tax=Chlorella ohadii TaxID=2649997 RepID=A0AAD5H284_9CHLO|nr:hypothetical protein COHA_005127 [Chlorella ohadii]